MLVRKMLREMRGNIGQFLSIMILAFLATFIFSGFESNVIGSTKALDKFHKATNLADGWLYSEGFTEENLKAVRELFFIRDAQLRTEIRGTTPEYDGAETRFYLMSESTVIKPYLQVTQENALKEKDGVAFDPADESGVWLNWTFANAWNIKVGDDLELEHNGVRFTRRVKGLIMTPEYEYTKAEKDADTNFKNLAYVYMGYDAFPFKDYLLQNVKAGKFTVESLKENEEVRGQVEKRLAEFGLTLDGLTNEMLPSLVENMDEERIRKLIPYTTMLVTLTEDAKKEAAAEIRKEKSGLSVPLYYEEAIAKAIDQNYAVMIDEKSVLGIQRVAAELEQHDMFSYAFAVIFLVIALLVISTTMSRLVERQRTVIGTMNAIGLKRWKIALHYAGYSFFIALIGAVAGVILGPMLIGNMMVNMIMTWYAVPGVSAGSNGSFAVVTTMVVVCCVLASYLSCRKLLKVPPAAALRPAAPKKAKRILAERLPFWNKFSFHTQYNLRDVSRAPMRAVMGIVGTMVGSILVIYAFGCYFLVDDLVEWNFGKLMNYEYQLVITDEKDAEYFDEMTRELEGEIVMADSIELAKEPHAPSLEKTKQTLTVIEGKGLYNVTDEKTRLAKLVPGKIAITSRLAKTMGVGVGDKVYWHIYSKNDWYESEIGSINRTPETSGITMLREDFEKTGCDYVPNMIVTKKDASGFENREGVSAVYSMADVKQAFIEGYEVIKLLFYTMMIFAVVTTVIVLYNAANLSFHERLKEFATLKVMGFSTGKIRGILNQENVWFAIIGVLVGIPLGKPAMLAMLNSNGDNFDYYVNIPIWLYLLGGAFVLLVATTVSLIFSKKIKGLDMVETLKGLD